MLLAGAAGIYLATWTGPVTFYWTFQRKLAAREAASPGVLSQRPRASGGEASVWTVRSLGDAKVPLPPGKVISTSGENPWLVKIQPETEREVGSAGTPADAPEIVIRLQPPGFLAELLGETMEALGVREEADSGRSDAAALEEILGTTLDDYRFAAAAGTAGRYAGKLLAKEALWEPGFVVRFEVARRGASISCLAEGSSGEAKVISAGPRGVLIAVLPAGAPRTWRDSPAIWLDD